MFVQSFSKMHNAVTNCNESHRVMSIKSKIANARIQNITPGQDCFLEKAK